MKLLDKLRRTRAKPEQRVELDDLGSVAWSEDDESWKGHASGKVFFLGFDPSSPAPLPELVEYVRSVLASDWLGQAVAAQKSQYAAQHPKFASELAVLEIESLHFYLRKGARHINCQLGYGAPGHFWSLDFKNEECTGVGFDT